jgi:hypothetical protein
MSHPSLPRDVKSCKRFADESTFICQSPKSTVRSVDMECEIYQYGTNFNLAKRKSTPSTFTEKNQMGVFISIGKE